MKRNFLYILSILFFACNNNATKNESNDNLNNNDRYHFVFSKDSGFIKKNEGLRILLSDSLTDTVNTNWRWIDKNDTIGNYYKDKTSGDYFVCIIDIQGTFETHWILEIKPDGSIIKSERYRHGNYGCCWNNYYEGFKKYGDYFGIKICGTGSGFCSSDLYIFKEIRSEDEQKPIPEYHLTLGPNNCFAKLSSLIEFKDDYIIMHYKFECGKLKNDSIYQTNTIEKYDVKYIYIKQFWAAKDTTRL